MKKTLIKRIAVPVIKAIAVKLVLDQIDKKFNKNGGSNENAGKGSKKKKKH